MITLERWRELWGRLGSDFGEERLYREIVAAYGEPHRAYHGLAHLEHCLEQLDAHRQEAESADEVELTLWFHDAVYRPTASDNEKQSADWARSAILDAGLAADLADRVSALILATLHDAVPKSADGRLIVDVDLSILGSPPEAYDRYEDAVRREYRWVPGFIFRKKRREILESFLRRDAIFLTAPFFELYERQARANLRRICRSGAEGE